MKKLFQSLGWALLYVVVYFAAGIAIGIVLCVAVLVAHMLNDPGILNDSVALSDAINNDFKSLTNIIIILTSILSFFIFLFIYRGRRTSIFKVCGIGRIRTKNIGLILLLGFTFNILISYLLNYITRLEALENAVKSYEEVAKSISTGNGVLTVIAVVLVAPLFEEIFFRGILYNELKKGMPLAVAFILQAVAFGLFHGNLIQGSYAFLLAILLGFVYIWFRSIWANIAFHLAFNLTAVLTDYVPDKFGEGLYAIFITIASGLIAILLLYLVYKERIKPVEGRGSDSVSA